MSKFFAISKNQVIVFITLLVLILLGSCYFFIYLPKNEKTVQERRFRCLQNIDTIINSKIDNSISLINNLLPDSVPVNADFKHQIDTLNKYIAVYPTNNFTLLKIIKSTKKGISADSSQLTFRTCKFIKAGKNSTWLSTGMQYKYDRFIKPLIPTEVFDNYVVFINNNTDKEKDNIIKIAYESFPSGLSVKFRDSLLATKRGIRTSGVHDITIGGAEYKMFTQPVSIGNKNELIIAGLVLNSNYQQEKNQLPLGIVLLLLTSAIIMIVSLPWIKLYHMGSKDTLTVTDGIWSVLVSMLLMSLLFFVIFKYSIYYNKSSYKRFAYSKNALANKVTTSFERELDSAYKILSACDTLYNKLAKGHKGDLSDKKYNNVLRNLQGNINAHEVFWLDTAGKVENSWFTDIKINKGSDFSARDYFIKTVNNHPNNIADTPFYLDQVLSHASGLFTSIIAKRSNDSTVAALGFTAKSLDNVIMPDGYRFAVIDSKGKVLYHSIEERNLNENLTKELADSSSLVSCMQAKSDTSFVSEYYGRQYNIKLMPFAHLPYFTVIFEDLEYTDARDTEPYAFTISMLICFLIFMVIQTGIVFFVSSRRSFFKKQLFETAWIGPKTTSIKQYNQAIIGNIVIIALLVAFFTCSSFLTYVYILLFSITFTAILLNKIFAIHYKLHNKYNYQFKIKAIWWLCIFVILLDYIAIETLDSANFLLLILFELLSAGVCTAVYKADEYLNHIFRKLRYALYKIIKYKIFQNWSYTKSFALMATTRLIITSGMPVAFLFIYSFNYEQSLDTRYRQLSFASALTQKIITDSLTKPMADSINMPKTDTSKNAKANTLKTDTAKGNTDNNKSIKINRRNKSTNNKAGLNNKDLIIGNTKSKADTANKVKIAKIKKSEYSSINKKAPFNTGIYFDDIFVHDYELYPISTKEESVIMLNDDINETREDSLTADILSSFRLYRNNIALKSNNLNFPSKNNDAFFYAKTLKRTGDIDRSVIYYKVAAGRYLKVSSGRIDYPFMKFFFWVLLFVLLYCFYYVIHNIIKKLFALNLPSTSRWEMMDDKLLADNKLNALLFILGSPGSGKLNKLKKQLKKNKFDELQQNELLAYEKNNELEKRNEKYDLYKTGKLLGNDGKILIYDEENKSRNNVFIADMIHISTTGGGEDDTDWKACKEEALMDKYALVIINHFEYNIKDTGTNSIKLDFLESLMLKSNSKIIIVSTVHPLTFLDSFNEQQKAIDAANAQKITIPESELERWHVLLGHFRIAIEPLNDILKTNDEGGLLKNNTNSTTLKRAIFDETRYSHYLNNMQQTAITSAPLSGMRDIDDISDSLIFKLQITSHYFYTYIWQSLTKEEKFLLYDLAEDGLVNPCDDYNLSLLICKGLIIKPSGTLILFNKGFRNYILTAIGNTEVNRIKDQVKDNGNWGSLKTPIIIAVLAIFVFLIASQQEAYTRIITYITALGAGVPAILKIFSLFPNSSQQKDS